MRRVAALVVVVVAVLVGAVLLGSEPLLNSEAVRGRMVDAVERGTGHGVRLGRIGLAPGSLLALAPVVRVQDVALLNGAGFSREALASARLVEVKLALLPLLAGRVEVRSVTLVGPDLLLERDAAGRGNWQRPMVVEGGPAPAVSAPRRRMAVEVGLVRVVNGRVEWRGAPAVEAPMLGFSPSGGAVEGRLLVNGVEVAVAGRTEAAGGPFEVTATGGGVVVEVSGKGDGSVGLRGRAGRSRRLRRWWGGRCRRCGMWW